MIVLDERIKLDYVYGALDTQPDIKKLRPSSNINGTQQIQELFGCGSLNEAQRKALAEEHTLDPRLTRDNILEEGSRAFLTEIGPAACQGLMGTALQVIASSSTVCSVAPPANDAQHKSPMRAFDLADSTISRRIPWLASFLKLIISKNVAGLADALREGIDGVIQQLQQGATVKTANYRVLVEQIQFVLQSLALDKMGLVKELLTSFAFRRARIATRDDGDADSDSEDDILSGEENQAPALSTASTVQIKSLTPSVAVQMLKAMMHIFKTTLAIWLFTKEGDVVMASIAYWQLLEESMDCIRRDHPHLSEEQIKEHASSHPLVEQAWLELQQTADRFNPLVEG